MGIVGGAEDLLSLTDSLVTPEEWLLAQHIKLNANPIINKLNNTLLFINRFLKLFYSFESNSLLISPKIFPSYLKYSNPLVL